MCSDLTKVRSHERVKKFIRVPPTKNVGIEHMPPFVPWPKKPEGIVRLDHMNTPGMRKKR